MKTKILKVTATLIAAAALGSIAMAGGNAPRTADTCGDCETCCASGEVCPVGTCCK